MDNCEATVVEPKIIFQAFVKGNEVRVSILSYVYLALAEDGMNVCRTRIEPRLQGVSSL